MNAIVVSSDITLKISKSVLGKDEVQTIDARELHKIVQSKRQFSDWIKRRIETYGFEEWKDFHKIVKPQNNATDYILTLDTAKEIAMVENNEQGRKIRRYLIEIEKKYQEEFIKWKITLPKECLHQAVMLAVQAGLGFHEKEKEFEKMKNILESQVHEIKELKANNNKYKALITNTSLLWQWEILLSMEEAGVQIGVYRNTIFRELRYRGMLNKDNSPRKGYELYFKQEKVKYKKKWTWNSYLQTFVTPEGLQFLKQIFV
jgi:phage anti-repressor protein